MRFAWIPWILLPILAAGVAVAIWLNAPSKRAEVADVLAPEETAHEVSDVRKTKAREFLALATERMGKRKNPVLDLARCEMARVQGRLGDFPTAADTLQDVEELQGRVQGLSELAVMLENAGQEKRAHEALASARKMLGTEWKPGDAFENWSEISRCLVAIGKAEAQLGDLAATKQTAELLNGRERADVLEILGIAMARRGDRAGAKKAFEEAWESVKDGEEWMSDVAGLARTQWKAGDGTGALRAVRSLRGKLEQAKGLVAVATEEIRAGRAENGKKLLQEAEDRVGEARLGEANEWRRVLVMERISVGLANLGEDDAAKEMLAEAKASVERAGSDCLALMDVGLAQEESGDAENGAATRKAAVLAVDKLPTEDNRVAMLWRLAAREAEAGHPNDAQELAIRAIGAGRTEVVVTAMQAQAVARGMARAQGAQVDLQWIPMLMKPGETANAYVDEQIMAWVGAAAGELDER